jgi:SAM-dependent methyltransferase
MAVINPRKLFYFLGPRSRLLARRLYYLPGDLWDRLTGRRDPLTPPKGLIFTGSGNFKEIGKMIVGYCQELGGLQPHHHVLDIGCGIGRVAIPLTDFLDPEKGRYEGFDAMERGIKWCKQAIEKRYPHFHFQYIPLKNDLYRADGADAATFVFPYQNAAFDLVILNSVFTHMVPAEVSNYLREIERVLRPGGACYATFFVLDEESTQLMEGVPDFSFPYRYEGYRLMDKEVKGANVAFDKPYLFDQLIQANGLQVDGYYPGFWPGRPKESCREFQDILLLKKPS